MNDESKITALMNAYTFGVGGGDVRFVEIFKRFTNTSITVVTPEQGVAFINAHGLTAQALVTAPDDSGTSALWSYPLRTLRALGILSKKKDHGIIYASSDFLPDVLPAVVFRKRGMRYVQVVHHLIPKPHIRHGGMLNNIISYLMQRISLNLIKMSADLVIVVSPLTKRNLIDLGFNESKLFMNPNGMDPAYFDGVVPGPVKYDAAFLGRMHVSKGIFDAVKIWKEVCKTHPEAKLAIIGGGTSNVTRELMDEIQGQHMENNIDLMGYLDRDAAFQLIKSSKIFVFPSHEEGFGIAILEAMACGVPVVAWDLPVYRDIFHEGMLRAPMGDMGAFSRNVTALLDDERGRKKVGDSAKALSKSYNWEKISSSEREIITSSF
ncbi:glycosyltransferase family 4 protein [Methanomassiliicoccus luminyensis]|jgi:glycosyltransferase involved in cell wall biosynthesis|uniref:glycosyltransferase family 4 protein n=1 Tax=Methanomassiliicoccus luminyensis TaxID=1080712 RepID=UPI00036E9953|nr:glycosyltransferase family 4 protein [Methanomassiliicoccus luminyensis]